MYTAQTEVKMTYFWLLSGVYGYAHHIRQELLFTVNEHSEKQNESYIVHST